MTGYEKELALKWFRNRLACTTMPGARKMFELAVEALENVQCNDIDFETIDVKSIDFR